MLKELELISVPSRPSYDSWNCKHCETNLQQGALVCLGCRSYDICLKCAEDGKGRRHIRQHPHDMVLFVLEVGGVLPEGVNAFVSGSPDIAENNDILERSEDPPPYVA